MEIAEENGIVMVFPQATGCFDTYKGTTGRNFCKNFNVVTKTWTKVYMNEN